MSQNDVWALIAIILMIPVILDMNRTPTLTLHRIGLALASSSKSVLAFSPENLNSDAVNLNPQGV